MNNKIKIFFTTIVFLSFLTTGSIAVYAENPSDYELQPKLPPIESLDDSIDEALENSTKEVVTPHVEDIKVMTPNSNTEVKNNVLKDSDNSLKFTVKKFLCAMGGVAVSSIILFLILIIMNKVNAIRHKGIPLKENEEPTKQKDEIIVPGGENDALRIFFEKTK